MTQRTRLRFWRSWVAVGAAACSLTVHAASTRPTTPTTDAGRVREVVLRAAKLCRWVDWPPRKKPPERPSEDPYLQAVRPVTEMGTAALPVLREMAADKTVTPFERRLAEILAGRIRNPKPFAAVDRQLLNPIPVRPGPRGHGNGPRVLYSPGPPLTEMYPLEVQELIKRYPQAWKQMQAAAREIVTPKPDSKGPITMEEWSRLDKVEAAIQSKHSIPNKEFAAIRYTLGVPPKYLMAYEEAAVRPLPPSWKRIFLLALTESAGSASAPSLGRLCRQAMDCRVISNRERRSVLSRIGRALIATPSRATLLEISNTVQYEKSRDPKSQHYFTGIVGYNLAEPESKWSRLLDEIGSEKGTAEHVRRLREVMQPYVEYFKKKAASASSKPAGAKRE